MQRVYKMKGGLLLFVGLLLITATETAAADQVAQGRAIYLQCCASCHGLTGEGNGPMARALTTPPANLRQLSDRYGNPLPEDQIARFIDGRADVKAHGLRDMPVWGKRFYSEGQGSERQVKDLIAKLVAYLQSIQTGVRSASSARNRWNSGHTASRSGGAVRNPVGMSQCLGPKPSQSASRSNMLAAGGGGVSSATASKSNWNG
jgi:mono/diheme cytochrome c family protein